MNMILQPDNNKDVSKWCLTIYFIPIDTWQLPESGMKNASRKLGLVISVQGLKSGNKNEMRTKKLFDTVMEPLKHAVCQHRKGSA